jgi:ankyrin repeat protein
MEIEQQKKLKSFIQAHSNEDEIIDALKSIDLETDLDGGTALNHAVNYDRVKTVKYLIEMGANVNAIQDDFTPLISACEGDNIEIIKMLLDAGADISHRDSFDNDAFWKAIFNENTEVIELLIEKGANPNSTSKNGKTYLERAVAVEKEDALKILKNH